MGDHPITSWLVAVALAGVGCASRPPAPPRPTQAEIFERQLQQIDRTCREEVAAGRWGGDLI